jgi:hypothetical protein
MEEDVDVRGVERIADRVAGVGVSRRGVGITSCRLAIGSALKVNGCDVLSLGFSTRSASRRNRKSRPYS